MITLVLGGTRSGKSAIAERLAGSMPPPVTYLATLAVGDDRELAERVSRHQARRPPDWTTVEHGPGADIAARLRSIAGTVLLDALGPLVAGSPDMRVDAAALTAALCERDGDSVIVSDEVGMGVHPYSADGRCFRDELGQLNQVVASVADDVLLVVAGRVLELRPFDLT